jgi:cytochrome P450
MARAATIPGPTGHPVFGMARELRGDLLGTLLGNFKRYGDFVVYRIGPVRGPRRIQRSVVAVHHPDAVQRVLSKDHVFTRMAGPLRAVREMFGENLVTADGEAWQRQRRTLQPLFTRQRITEYSEAMEAEARRVIGDLAVPGEVVDVARLVEVYTLRVLGRTLFKGPGELDERTVADLGRLVPLVGRAIRSRAILPLRAPLTWPTPANRRFVKTRDELYAVVDRVLDSRLRDNLPLADEDLLARLQAAREPETGETFSAQEVRDQALMFLLAGHTTTTSALTSTVYLLGRNPEIQERVAQAAASPPPLSPAPDLVSAAVMEGMRLYPPSSMLARRALVDTELGEHTIAAGSNVLVSAWVTHRHPEFWEAPEVFDPHRFIDAQSRPRCAYFPFGDGGRTCIGRHFALAESTILVRELLRSYRLVALDAELPMAQLASLRPSGPVRIKFERR